MSERLRSTRGDALIETLFLLAGALLPLLALLALTSRIELAHLTVEQTARAAARAASEATTQTGATIAAETIRRQTAETSGEPLSLQLGGQLQPGSSFTATLTTTIHSVPFAVLLGEPAALTVAGRATVPVDRYRSLP